MTRNVMPMSTTLAVIVMMRCGPMSRNRSSWLTSSLRIVMSPPEVWSSK